MVCTFLARMVAKGGTARHHALFISIKVRLLLTFFLLYVFELKYLQEPEQHQTAAAALRPHYRSCLLQDSASQNSQHAQRA